MPEERQAGESTLAPYGSDDELNTVQQNIMPEELQAGESTHALYGSDDELKTVMLVNMPGEQASESTHALYGSDDELNTVMQYIVPGEQASESTHAFSLPGPGDVASGRGWPVVLWVCALGLLWLACIAGTHGTAHVDVADYDPEVLEYGSGHCDSDDEVMDAECSIGKGSTVVGYLDCQCRMRNRECDCDLARGEHIIECFDPDE